MVRDEIKELIKINGTYRVKDSQSIPRIATVDTLSELDDGSIEITYHYNSERTSKWFLTAEEFLAKFKCE